MSRPVWALCATSALAVACLNSAYSQSQTPLTPVIVESGKPKATKRARPARVAPPGARRTAADRNRQSTPPPAAPAGTVPVVNTTAGPVQGYRALTATSATKTDTPIERVPQSIQVIPRKLIDDQSAISVSEALQNVSSVQSANTLIVGNTDFYPLKIRGFGAEQWRDGLVNLYAVGNRDGLVNVERIEVLKGPNAILYGGGAGAPIGGTVNVISKLPMDKARYEIGGTFGSFSYWNPYFDINQPLNPEKTALFRITGEYTGNRSFIDVIDARRYNINPTLTLTNRDDTSLTIQAHVAREQQQGYPGLPVFGTIMGDFRVRTDLYTGPSSIEPSYTKTEGVTVTFDHQFNSIWSTNIKARWSQSEFDQNSQSIFGTDFTGATPLFPPSTWYLTNIELFQKQREFTINPTLKAKFALGETQNTLLFGADYSRVSDSGFMNADYLGNGCFVFLGLCPPAATVDLANPVFTVPYVRPNPASPEFFSFFNFQNTYVTKGVYTQLQSSIYDRIHLLVGGRLASIDITYNENALAPPATFVTEETRFLPRAGVVVDLVKGLSAFVSYSEGMKWAGFTTAVSRPAPEFSKQIEGGLKFNVNNVLTGTLAVFGIERENVPVLTSLGQAGLAKQQSRGFEADVIYQPNYNWSLLGNYSFTDATFADPFSSNGVVVPVGNKLPAVPEHSGRFWVLYKFDPGFLSGWSVGAGIYVASSQFVDAPNLWRTDGYFTVDGKVGYENEKVRAAITVKNLTGEKYFTPYTWLTGQVAPGAPRSIYGSIAYKFN
jgi:iron complex outermembrane receptor protein